MEKRKLKWIAVEDCPLPLEEDIIVQHPYGVEAIHFFGATWRYWYTNELVPKATLDTITHWCKP